jgi:hypothetical protein
MELKHIGQYDSAFIGEDMGEQLEKLTVTGKKWQDGNGGECCSSSSSGRQKNSRADQCYVGKDTDRNLCVKMSHGRRCRPMY